MENDGFEYASGTILLFLSMVTYHSVVFCIEQCFPFIYFNEEWHLLEEKARDGRSLFLTAATLINPERRTPHNLSMAPDKEFQFNTSFLSFSFKSWPWRTFLWGYTETSTSSYELSQIFWWVFVVLSRMTFSPIKRHMSIDTSIALFFGLYIYTTLQCFTKIFTIYLK